MTELPRVITVDTFHYNITDLPPQDDHSGDYCRRMLQIRLRRDVAPAYLRKTFTHELLHLLWDVAGLTDDPTLDRNLEERIVEALAARLLPVLRDNPEMVAWLMDA